MKRMVILGVFLMMITCASAQGTTAPTAAQTTVQQTSDLPDPGITPDSWFYGLKKGWQSIDLMLTFGQEAKAQKQINYANERLAEINYLVKAKKLNEAMQIKTEYEQTVKDAENNLQQAEANGADTSQARSNIQQQIQRHEQVLQKVIDKVENPTAKAALQETLKKQEEQRQQLITKLQEIEKKQAEKRAEQDKKRAEQQNKTCGACPVLSPANPEWCKDGTVTATGVDECGCQKPPKCVRAENHTGPQEAPKEKPKAKAGELCGGIAGIRCIEGYTCNAPVTGTSDTAGTCVPEQKSGELSCGGITAKGCPEMMYCKIDAHYPDAAGVCKPKSEMPPLPCGTNGANPTSCIPKEGTRTVGEGEKCGGSIGYSCAAPLICNGATSPPGNSPNMVGWDIGRCVKQNDVKPIGLANPASLNCQHKGGTLEIRSEKEGQTGYCHLVDGTVCEEWAFMKGQCPVKATN